MLSCLLAVAAAAAPTAETSFAIVVGNNQSPVLGRRSLQYADDDAVKYAEVFRALVSPDNLRLLTAPDEDTERLFGSAVSLGQRPTREALRKAFAEMGAAIANGKKSGRPTRAWFVFAGHGDVDKGQGFIELEDGAFTGDDLVAALKGVEADELHVILDSCNSFFVLAPRKPGGRHFTTPADAALELSQRLPKVGVLLSTSAEAEVYEWSAFQSGIFSHAVRSGLTGAADVNGDGRVSYAEIAAFVNTASRSVPNPVLRPQVFARGPDGDNARPLVDNATSSAMELDAASTQPLRLTLRDSHGIRWFDLHAEANAPLKLRLPASVLSGLSIEQETTEGLKAWRLPEQPGNVTWAQLVPAQVHTSARGADQALKALYELPFGPVAFQQWEKRAQAPADKDAYIGLAKADVDRMHIILAQAAHRDRATRTTLAYIFGAAGAGSLIAGGVEAGMFWNYSNTTPRWAFLGTYGGLGAVFGGLGALFYFKQSPWEDELAAFEHSTAAGDWRSAIARADAFIDKRATTIRRMRWVQPVMGGVIGAIGAALFTWGIIYNSLDNASLLARPLGLVLLGEGIGLLLATSWQSEPEEDLLNVWREERQLTSQQPRVNVGIAPVRGGAALSLSGTF